MEQICSWPRHPGCFFEPRSHRRAAFPLPYVPLVFRGVRPKSRIPSTRPRWESPYSGDVCRWACSKGKWQPRWTRTRAGHERKASAPRRVWYCPAIFSFLGYDPFSAPTTLAERIASQRRRLGLSLKEAALKIGVDEDTFLRWDRGDWKPRKSQYAVEAFLALPCQ